MFVMLKTETLSSLGIKKCSLFVSLGILPHEKIREQQVLLTLTVEADVTACFASDALEDTLDYLELLAVCQQVAKRRHYNLIENLASCILDAIAERFSLASAEILLEKLQAIEGAQSSFVILKRRFNA
jgi:dihydroneopterin aldolase